MRKIYKIASIALIFILIAVFLFHDTSYSSDISCLRIPISEYANGRISQVFNKTSANPVEKAGWDELEFISGTEGAGYFSFTQEVKYKGGTYFAKWPVKKYISAELVEVEQYYDDRFIVPEARILRYLKTKGVQGIPSVEHLLEMEDGTKVILFKKFDKGDTLDEKIDKLSQSEAIDIMLKVSGIVKSLLDNGVYHWDIKPNNVWITDKGKIILFDFGLSFMTKEEFIDRKLYGCATPPYNSLNRIKNTGIYSEDTTFSPSDEIYSLGLNLAEALGLDLQITVPFFNIEYNDSTEQCCAKLIKDIIYRTRRIPRKFRNVLKNALSSRDSEGNIIYGKSSYENIDAFIKDLEKLALQKKPGFNAIQYCKQLFLSL